MFNITALMGAVRPSDKPRSSPYDAFSGRSTASPDFGALHRNGRGAAAWIGDGGGCQGPARGARLGTRSQARQGSRPKRPGAIKNARNQGLGLDPVKGFEALSLRQRRTHVPQGRPRRAARLLRETRAEFHGGVDRPAI